MNAPRKNHRQIRIPPVRRAGQLITFSVAYLLFGSVGVITSVASFLLALGFRSAWAHRLGQQTIHYLFRFFVWYLRTCRLLNLQADDLHTLRGHRNLILVANHPSLLDAVFIAAHLPNLFCLMKANLIHNLVLCGQSKLAGYVNNKSGVGLMKACLSRIGEGSNLLVFPEGTRTLGQLGRFKMGFALISRAVRAPIQTLVIRYDHNFLGKGWPFFQPPPFPLTCSIRLGKQFHPDPGVAAQAFGLEVEEYLRAALNEQESATVAVAHE